MIQVTERDKGIAESVANMIADLRILPLTRRMADYERAKKSWAELCLSNDEYEAGVRFIADWVGV